MADVVDVRSVTPSDAAAAESHPDHDRWVKERTLAMEIKHAEACGGTLRDAETENARLLARMDALAKIPPKPIDRTTIADRDARNDERGVVVRAPKNGKKLGWRPARCGDCGRCIECRRNMRVYAIVKARNSENELLKKLAAKLMGTVLDNARGVGKFTGLSRSNKIRRLAAIFEEVCDASVPALGAWR